METDSNGTTLRRNVRRGKEGGTWGVNVWFGGANGLGTNVRRYYYQTRATAQEGGISDEVGRNGRVQ